MIVEFIDVVYLCPAASGPVETGERWGWETFTGSRGRVLLQVPVSAANFTSSAVAALSPLLCTPTGTQTVLSDMSRGDREALVGDLSVLSHRP